MTSPSRLWRRKFVVDCCFQKRTEFLSYPRSDTFMVPRPSNHLSRDRRNAFQLSKTEDPPPHRPPPPFNKTAQRLIGSYPDAITCARWSLRLSPWKLALSADTIERLCYLSIDLNSSGRLDPRGGCHRRTKGDPGGGPRRTAAGNLPIACADEDNSRLPPTGGSRHDRRRLLPPRLTFCRTCGSQLRG